jgi:hypothetical protein
MLQAQGTSEKTRFISEIGLAKGRNRPSFLFMRLWEKNSGLWL